MQERSIWTRGSVFAVGMLALLLGVFAGNPFTGNLGAGSRASAQEPAFVLFGIVSSGDAPLPSRVRASIGDVVCGTAQVQSSGNGAGVYALAVAPADRKAGCGTSGATVRMALLSGEIDSGIVVGQVLWRGGQSQRFDLYTAPDAADSGTFAGQLPTGPGVAYLRWTGASAVPIARAVATIPREVTAVYFWNVRQQAFDSYIPNGGPIPSYTLVDADDIVLVHVR